MSVLLGNWLGAGLHPDRQLSVLAVQRQRRDLGARMTDPLMTELGKAAYDERFRELVVGAKTAWEDLPPYAKGVWLAVAEAVVAKQAELYRREQGAVSA
jgi:hypothetical protein